MTGETSSIGPDDERQTVPESVVRRVWVAAGGRCTMCNTYLLEDSFTGQSVFIGQLAHIVGATRGAKSPRGDHPMTKEERAGEANLMLLCHDQHKTIDSRDLWSVYTVQELRALKVQHERDVRDLTGLRERGKSTVLRVVGDIRGKTYDASRATIVQALLAQQRFPDWSLLDGDDFEVDLRGLPGEKTGETYYWDAARAKITQRLLPLGKHLRDNRIEHVSVFGLARIPLLIHLGSLLDDGSRITVNPKNRDNDTGWGWPGDDSTPPVSFTVVRTAGTGEPVVTFSLTADVNADALPDELAGRPRYDVRPNGVGASPTLLRSAADLDAFTRTWRDLLAELEGDHRDAPIAVVPAVPAAAAINMGCW